jgi:hypothetical protein
MDYVLAGCRAPISTFGHGLRHSPWGEGEIERPVANTGTTTLFPHDGFRDFRGRAGPARARLRAFQPVKRAVVSVGVLSEIICELPLCRKEEHFQNYSCKKNIKY